MKSEYYDTETIVDPLEEGHVTRERLEETKMDYTETTFLVGLNQQAVSDYTRFCGEDWCALVGQLVAKLPIITAWPVYLKMKPHLLTNYIPIHLLCLIFLA